MPSEKLPETLNKNTIKFSDAMAALKHRNFRLFWTGQCISLTGTWMQNMAQAWLVLELTKSAFWLGVVTAVQFAPMLLFSLSAGTLVDRFPKRKMLLFTQAGLALLALILASDIWLHTVRLWHILIVAGFLGVLNTLDMPTRQSFIIELVGPRDLMNAIVLNSAVFNGARVLGPSLAGLAIAKLGIDVCFFLNALSFLPVIAGIASIRTQKEFDPPVIADRKGILSEIRTGISFVKNTPGVMIPISILIIISIFTMNFNVIVPLFAKNVFHQGAQGFGFLMSANGLGALLGSVVLAVKSARMPRLRTLIAAALGICLFELLLAPEKIYGLAYLCLFLVGVCMITFTTTCNSIIQLQTPNHLRGRVMSIYSLVFAGFAPIGSLLTGTTAHAFGAPVTMGLQAGAGILLILAIVLRNRAVLREK